MYAFGAFQNSPKYPESTDGKPSFPASPHFCFLLGGDWGTAEFCSEDSGSVSDPSSLSGAWQSHLPGKKVAPVPLHIPQGLGLPWIARSPWQKGLVPVTFLGQSRPLWDITEFIIYWWATSVTTLWPPRSDTNWIEHASCLVGWHRHVIHRTSEVEAEDPEFEVSLGYVTQSCLPNPNTVLSSGI